MSKYPHDAEPAQPAPYSMAAFESAPPSAVSGNVLRRTTAAGVLALVVTAGTSDASPSSIYGSETHAIYAVDTESVTAPIAGEVPADVRRDFEEALAVDTCETEVTVEEVTSLYRRLWLTRERPHMTAREYQSRADQLTNTLREDRERLGIGVLPVRYRELYEDVRGDNVIPLEVYKETVAEYLSGLGIKAHFDWETAPQGGIKNGATEEVMTSGVPLSAGQEERHADDLRQNLVATIAAVANMPPAVMNDPKVVHVYFGDLSDRNVGLYAGSSNAILLELAAKPYVYRGVIEHEGLHNLTIGLCSAILEGPGKGVDSDPSYESLNDTFTYRRLNDNFLGMNKLIDGQYTSLHTSPDLGGRVVSADPYGTINHSENIAVDMGEAVHAGNLYRLYREDGRDRTIMQEKLTLEIARLAKKPPLDGKYLTDLMELARFQRQLLEDSFQAYEAVYAYYSINPLYRPFDDETTGSWRRDRIGAPLYHRLQVLGDIRRGLNQHLDLSFPVSEADSSHDDELEWLGP
jgi:hypothetical protein